MLIMVTETEAAAWEEFVRRGRYAIAQRSNLLVAANDDRPIRCDLLHRIACCDAIDYQIRWRSYGLLAVSGDPDIDATKALDLLTSACDVGAEAQLRGELPATLRDSAGRSAAVRHEIALLKIELGHQRDGVRHLRAALALEPDRFSARNLLERVERGEKTLALEDAFPATPARAALDRAAALLQALSNTKATHTPLTRTSTHLMQIQEERASTSSHHVPPRVHVNRRGSIEISFNSAKSTTNH